MGSVYLLFDYFKEAFRLNRDNKVLYRPQIVFIILKSLLILGIGVWLYTIMDRVLTILTVLSFGNWLGDFSNFFPNFIYYLLLGILVLIITVIMSVALEAGLYNMYKRVILDGQTNIGDFWQGISRYLFKFLLGDIVVIFIWGAAVVAYIIVGFFTFFIAFLIPLTLVVSLFLTMWKVSLVMNDHGVIESITDSFKFAKRHFWPLAVLQVVHWSFIGGVSGGGSGSSFNNLTKLSDRGLDSNVPRVDYASIERFIKIAIGILIPVISVASAVAALIMMIFEVFFTITIFIAYKNNFKGFGQAAVEGVELYCGLRD